KARSNAARWQEIESLADGSAAEPLSQLAWQELRLVLDEEIGRLPARYRAPVILCYLEGLSYTEAARHLGCPPGTVSGRLARAREVLRGRLARRGFGLSAALLGTLLPASSPAAVAVPLLDATVKAAVAHVTRQTLAAGAVSAPIAALAEGVIQAMLWTKLKVTVAVLVVAGLAGAGGFVYRSQAADSPKEKPGTAPAQKLPPQKPSALPNLKQPPAKAAALPDPKQAADKAAQAEQEKLLLLRKLAELQLLQAEQEALQARLELARARLAKIQAVQEKQRQQALDQIEQGLRQLRKTGGNDKAIEEFDKAFQQLKRQLAQKNAKPAGQPEGVVNEINKDGLVKITIQNGAEAQRGQVLHVYRLEPEPMYLGKLTVVEVKGKEAVGKVEAASPKKTIKPNDRVSVISPE
ncbi:MAG: sigma-70 family RNA polymerase sigma factor, partial [Planctomycetes bacterium]|nr:sigma-70 family RNA polymerase sigma factor [Planctomycetota bacterium]